MIEPTETELTREERIRSLAYRLWQEDGCPEGCAEDHWFKAGTIVDAEAADPDWLRRAAPADEPKAEARNPTKRRAA